MSERIIRKLLKIEVSWGKRTWFGGERGHEGVNFTLDREDGITQSVTGNLTQGTMRYKDIPVSRVVDVLRRIRRKRVADTGEVNIVFVWGATPSKPHGEYETVYRAGKYSGSIHDQDKVDIGTDLETPLKSQAADMIRVYVETGCEGTLAALQDYLSDKFPRSVVVTDE